MKNILACGALFCAITIFSIPNAARAHGFEGDRFFPPTIQTDDPFATDELALPTIQYNPATASRETDVNGSFTKEIFPKFAFSVSGSYVNLNPKGGPSQDGFNNITLNVKYQLWEVPEHEFILSLGSYFDLGDTGSKGLGVDSFTTYTPTIYFGKGFNELPSELKYLRPLALTAQVGLSIPAESANPDGSFNSDTLQWGGALEYSMPYLQEHVVDIDLPRPFRDMIPLVEFTMSSPIDRSGITTTGTINPGILWEGKYCQIGAEAVIPVNSHSGPAVGAVFQVQIFIDDLFPKVFGHPIFFDKENN
jgi:hypothetical protein